MRILSGLVAACLLAAPVAAVADTRYDIAPAPAAYRGKVVEIDGVRSFVAKDGWYVMALGPTGTEAPDGEDRLVTYDAPGTDDDITVWISTYREPGMDLDMEYMQSQNAVMLSKDLDFPGTLVGRKMITQGDGNGKTPVGMAVWFTEYPESPGRVKAWGSCKLPHGVLMVIVEASDAATAEAVIRDHLRVAEGALD